MQLHTCPAQLPDDDAGFCNVQVTPPLPFCPHHYHEYCTLKEKARAAEREGDALKDAVDRLSADGDTTVYNTVREVQAARTVAELYTGALGRQIEAGNALRALFGPDDAVTSIAELEAKQEGAAAVVGKLVEREGVLVAEENALRAVADLRLILREPHQPFSCPATRAEGQCLREGCRSRPTRRQGFCWIHTIEHDPALLRSMWNAMEAARMQVAGIEVATGTVASRSIVATKAYIRRVNKVIEDIEKHQATYSCKSE
ncbi:hypothetical protein L226DRAFT_272524 [Lentinus tigrinus ALCF2SS1-7]|uniref:uncharacterized protein n=1 Tax=Lentinus tigrinus ALCF2SS1-7 TaxID=1328758 RepID=UPI001165F00C|nr:hypothetical protein L226DRAFT_272524 [Lentinus tigrinus ALCF2SS1-7]